MHQLKINHILCSNLVHFAYLVQILSQTERVQGVDFPIKTSGNHKSTTRIDIVADGGRTWIKVIARNPKALNDIAFGRSNYGTKSILDHAISYIDGALDNQCCFQNPTVGDHIFWPSVRCLNKFSFFFFRSYLISRIQLTSNWRHRWLIWASKFASMAHQPIAMLRPAIVILNYWI